MKFTSKTETALTYVIPYFEQTITVICCGIALAVPVPDETWAAVLSRDAPATKALFPSIMAAWNAMPFGTLLPMTMDENGVLQTASRRVEVRVLTKPLEMIVVTGKHFAPTPSSLAPAA